MGSVFFPSTINCNRLILNSPSISSQRGYLNQFSLHNNIHKARTSHVISCFGSPFSLQPVIRTGRGRRLLLVAFDDENSGLSKEEEDEEEEEVNRALETVLKLFSAIKNRNIQELSDIISDECQCVCNFIFSVQGKKQVLDFLTYLMGSLGKHVEFVIKPTWNNGLNVGIKWKLECEKTHVPLGNGFSFYICQIYQGKVLIRNVEIFIDPLLHMGPFRLKMIGRIMNLMKPLSFHKITRHEIKRALYKLLIIIFITVILFFSKPGMY